MGMARKKNDKLPTEQRSSRNSSIETIADLNQVGVSAEERHLLISEAAYFRAEDRGFVPGQELDDWLAAEIQIDNLMQTGLVASLSE
jgi:hypothetical protein